MTGMATALCAAISMDGGGDVAPEWVHLLPVGEVRTVDGRGPYRVVDPAAVIAASMAGGKLALDENHSTDLAAPRGGAAPARGWIAELQQRPDGVWGRVDWTAEAQRTGLHQAYRGVSPVIRHRLDGTVTSILRASLTNTPNFRGLIALHHQENTMDFRAWLIEALGLAADASDDAIVAAMNKRLEAGGNAVALQSALAPIAAVVGLGANADAAAVLAGVEQLRDASGDAATITALQSELANTATRLNIVIQDNARRDAEAFVDGAIAAGRVGVKPQRDRYISRHMAQRADTEELINALPCVPGGATLLGDAPKAKDGLGAAHAQVVSLMGIDREAYAATLAAEGSAVA